MAYEIFVFSGIVIYIALAVLLHLQFGVMGIVNFGVVGFWGLGMYANAVLQVQYGVPYFIAIIISTAIVALIAFLLGLLILDLDSQSILVATLAFATIVMHLVTTEKWLTKGVIGIGTVDHPFAWLNIGRQSDLLLLIILLLITAAIMLYAYHIQKQPYGRLMLSIQDNEKLAQGIGKPTFWHKLAFFTVTCGLMGLLGAFHASVNRSLFPQYLVAGVTFTVWIGLILGGKRWVWGGVIGVLATVGLFDLIIETYVPLPRQYAILIPNIKLMLYGLMLMVVLMFRPLGILGDRRRNEGDEKVMKEVKHE